MEDRCQLSRVYMYRRDDTNIGINTKYSINSTLYKYIVCKYILYRIPPII